MNFNPKVSIVIPVYNGSNYLKEAIDSALAQTYTNIEVVVVNDGSSDNGATEKIALSYGDQIRYFSKQNGGVATALNLGIEKMTGEYFSWLSHDDLYMTNKISEQVNYLSKLKNYNVILFTDFESINENGDTLHQSIFDHQWLEQKPLYALLRSCIHGCSLLIPRCFFEKYGVFDVKLKTTQDYALWFKMIRSEHFIHLPMILIKSRVHPEQDTYKHPNVVLEADALWMMMMDSLTTREMMTCEKSIFDFYIGIYYFLSSSSPYKTATHYALMKAKKASIYRYIKIKVKLILNEYI